MPIDAKVRETYNLLMHETMPGDIAGKPRLEGDIVCTDSKMRVDKRHGGTFQVLVCSLGMLDIPALSEGLTVRIAGEDQRSARHDMRYASPRGRTPDGRFRGEGLN